MTMLREGEHPDRASPDRGCHFGAGLNELIGWTSGSEFR
jgi:hypothetical protein